MPADEFQKSPIFEEPMRHITHQQSGGRAIRPAARRSPEVVCRCGTRRDLPPVVTYREKPISLTAAQPVSITGLPQPRGSEVASCPAGDETDFCLVHSQAPRPCQSTRIE